VNWFVRAKVDPNYYKEHEVALRTGWLLQKCLAIHWKSKWMVWELTRKKPKTILDMSCLGFVVEVVILALVFNVGTLEWKIILQHSETGWVIAKQSSSIYW